MGFSKAPNPGTYPKVDGGFSGVAFSLLAPRPSGNETATEKTTAVSLDTRQLSSDPPQFNYILHEAGMCPLSRN